MKNLKNQKGITLVALVVTIIVLLILAGVSLKLVAGSNGIITKAANAKNKNTDATAKEQVTLMIAQWTTEFYEKVYTLPAAERLSVNKDPGTWIKETYPGTESGAEKTVNSKTIKPNKTTDEYNFFIGEDIIIPDSNDANNIDKNYYVVRITGTKNTSVNPVENRTQEKGLDKRLSEDITGKLTVSGKLTWD